MSNIVLYEINQPIKLNLQHYLVENILGLKETITQAQLFVIEGFPPLSLSIVSVPNI